MKTICLIPGGGGTSLHGLYRYVKTQGYGLSAVLVIKFNMVSNLAIFVLNRYGFSTGYVS